MKKIAMMLFCLAIVLPTFGQKLNSRGEKMVSSISHYFSSDQLDYTINFQYNSSGALTSFEREDFYSGRSSTYRIMRLDVQNSKIVLLSGKKDVKQIIYDIELDENNHILKLKGNIDRNHQYILQEFTYEYIDGLNKYTLVADSVSSWEKEWDGERQVLRVDGDWLYQCERYTYDDGNPYKTSITHYFKNNGDDRIGKRSTEYGDAINDTNININSLIWDENFRSPSDGMNIRLTEWCPLRSKNLPTSDNYYTYQYEFSNGNLIGLRVYLHRSASFDDEGHLQENFKISYLED